MADLLASVAGSLGRAAFLRLPEALNNYYAPC